MSEVCYHLQLTESPCPLVGRFEIMCVLHSPSSSLSFALQMAHHDKVCRHSWTLEQLATVQSNRLYSLNAERIFGTK